MLVLSRRKDESIAINHGEIIIRVLEIVNGRVRLGIEAPTEILVDRMEVHEAKLRDKERDEKDLDCS